MIRTFRHRILVALSAVLALQLLAVAVIHVGILRPIEQQRVRERREALEDLTKRAIIVQPEPLQAACAAKVASTGCVLSL